MTFGGGEGWMGREKPVLYTLLMNKSLTCFMHPFDEQIFKLCKLKFGIVCCFNILVGIRHIRYFFCIFCTSYYKLERPAFKMPILWWRTDICACKLSAKVSLTLGNPFSVPSLCKLNHITVYFIQISTNFTCKQVIPFRESHVFLK